MIQSNVDVRIDRRAAVQVGALGLFLASMAGCQESDLTSSPLYKKFVSAEQPTNVSSLKDAYAQFEEGKEVVVVGRIFSPLESPFDPNQASFSLIELPKPGHDHDNPGDCPFCKREMENSATAVVQVVGEDGQVLKGSAEKILGLKNKQDLIISGTSQLVGETLVLSANSLHILSKDAAMLLAKQVHGTKSVTP